MAKQILFFMFFSLIITCVNSNGMKGPTQYAFRTTKPVELVSEVILTKDSPVSSLNGTKMTPDEILHRTVQSPIGSAKNSLSKSNCYHLFNGEYPSTNPVVQG